MVKELTGLPINHVVNVDFLGFVRAVDAIDCVYVDVDRRYYHSNAESTEEYAEINVQPGYQLLCGKKALQYVRYRHTDTDLVRAARQQDFISAARQRVPVERPAPRPQRPDRHLHRIHDLRHQRHRNDDRGAQTLRRLAQRGDQRGPLPGRTRPQLRHRHRRKRSKTRSNSSSASKRASGSRGTLEEDPRTKQEAKKKAQEEEEEEAPGRDAEAARAATDWCPPREAGEPRRRSSPARSAAASRSSSRPGCPPAPTSRKRNPYLTHRRPARLPLQGHRRRDRHGAYRMVLTVELPDGTHYFGVQGIQGWSDPPILERPERNADDQRPRVRHLHRRRPGQADRLAPRRQQLLDLQRPAQHADQRPDGRHGALRERDRAQPEAEEGQKGSAGGGRMSRSG